MPEQKAFGQPDNLKEERSDLQPERTKAPTDMLSEFVEETMENIHHLFDDAQADKRREH
ncbi:hypothetical protein [Paenibacillus rigui]|uniref:hypothetical protein n=1 Tax=Paenibacillus rigui TaxID=554312 RepID=UPI0015C665BF|nr:hypothetical protein [Paenibacillus rigui]